MKFQTNMPIHQHMARIFNNKEAVVFCGAGVSLEPPAGLPDWHKLRDETLKAIANKHRLLQSLLSNLTSKPMIAAPNKKGLSPEVVASFILDDCKGYFESFRALEDGEPNANHRYLAKMAKSGLLKYIVTTNFDLFIEHGLKNEGVNYKVYRTEDEFANLMENKDGVHVVKLHGCISEPTTITATVEQEGKGLFSSKFEVLQYLLSNYYFIFWGYSGADLKIDLDYLRMVTMKKTAKGFIWNFLKRPDYEEPINPYVAKLAKIYRKRAHIVHGKLPEIFDNFLSPQDKIKRTKYTLKEEKSWQKKKDISLQKALKKWSKEYLEPANAYNIFGGLLRHSGHVDEALKCYKKAEKITSSQDNKQGLAIPLNNIGVVYNIKGDYDQALVYYRKAEEITNSLGDKQGLAMCLNNIGMIYKTKKNYKEAIKYYQEAVAIARTLDDKKKLAANLNNIGGIFNAIGKHDLALKYFKQSEEIANSLGDKQGLAMCFNNIGIIYKAKGEYDLAIECYKKSEEISRVLGDKQRLATNLNNIGSIYSIKEKHRLALKYFKQAFTILEDIGDVPHAAICSKSIGLAYEHKLKQHKKASSYYKKSIEYYRQINMEEKVQELQKLINNCQHKQS